MLIAYHPNYVYPLPQNHRFPMEKYDLIKRQLIHEGLVTIDDFFEPNNMVEETITKVHDENYWKKLKELQLSDREQRISGFIHSSQLIEREMTIMEGTRQVAENSLKNGLGFNIAGGTHHAFTNRGEGFCLLNDQVIAAKWLLENKLVENVLIVDLDVHQGNGSAEMCQNDNRIFTFSMHGASNYPLKKEVSNLDVSLQDGTKDKEYLYSLEYHLEKVLSEFTPDFIFYQCGVDVLESDKLGKLSLSKIGCQTRDRIVFNITSQLQVPIVCTMGGGYSPKISDIVNAHTNTFREGLFILT